MSHAAMGNLAESIEANQRARARRRRSVASNGGWYVVLSIIAFITVFPFLWMLSTSLKGPADLLTSGPPQSIPPQLKLANYERVLNRVPSQESCFNSVVVSVAVGG